VPEHLRYECDQCGACCQGPLIVEADDLDMMREPRLVEADPKLANTPLPQVIDALRNDLGRVIVLACGHPCPFLAADNRCSIYPTRPNACVAMPAGDEQCQLARLQAGLAPLEPVDHPGDDPASGE